jgi:hypothetical protein
MYQSAPPARTHPPRPLCHIAELPRKRQARAGGASTQRTPTHP